MENRLTWYQWFISLTVTRTSTFKLNFPRHALFTPSRSDSCHGFLLRQFIHNYCSERLLVSSRDRAWSHILFPTKLDLKPWDAVYRHLPSRSNITTPWRSLALSITLADWFDTVRNHHGHESGLRIVIIGWCLYVLQVTHTRWFAG